MQIAVNRVSAPRKEDHLVVLLDSAAFPSSARLSPSEKLKATREKRKGKSSCLLHRPDRFIYILWVSDKNPQALRLEKLRKAAAGLASKAQGYSLSSVSLIGSNSEYCLAFTEGLLLSSYRFDKYLSKKPADQLLRKVHLICSDLSQAALSRLLVVCEANHIARDLVNEPASFLTAAELGRQFVSLSKQAGFKSEILQKEKIKSLKMGGLLAVNLGSPQPPTFSILEWKPAGHLNKKPIVLVGKGVVYDTGGMSLKPTPNSMDYMKCDMAGGATVACALYAAAKANLPLHLVALIPATDNRPDGDAYVPGDVITMMSGKTVEVLNTDAEGRLILADALHYAKRYDPEIVLEFSTLTGAASAAIGPYGIVCMGTIPDEERKRLHLSGENVFERLAEFPFWDEYDELIKSDIADLKNVGGPNAGAITAGRFLKHFTDYPFMHFDIAGPAFSKSADSYRGKNGTGIGVRLLFDYFLSKINDTPTN